MLPPDVCTSTSPPARSMRMPPPDVPATTRPVVFLDPDVAAARVNVDVAVDPADPDAPARRRPADFALDPVERQPAARSLGRDVAFRVGRGNAAAARLEVEAVGRRHGHDEPDPEPVPEAVPEPPEAGAVILPRHVDVVSPLLEVELEVLEDPVRVAASDLPENRDRDRLGRGSRTSTEPRSVSSTNFPPGLTWKLRVTVVSSAARIAPPAARMSRIAAPAELRVCGWAEAWFSPSSGKTHSARKRFPGGGKTALFDRRRAYCHDTRLVRRWKSGPPPAPRG